MIISFEIDESEVNGFSVEAHNSLIRVCKDYANGIVAEAKRIESNDRSGGNDQIEVIASHIDEAKKNYRKISPKSKGKIIISVIVDVLMLIVGATFDKDSLLNNNAYLIIYIILIAITIVFLVIKYARGE